MVCLRSKPSQCFLSTIYKAKKIFTVKELFKEKGEWRIEQKIKRRLFNCSHYGNDEGPYNFNK